MTDSRQPKNARLGSGSCITCSSNSLLKNDSPVRRGRLTCPFKGSSGVSPERTALSQQADAGKERVSRRQFIAAASGLALPLLVGCRPEGRSASLLRVGICDALAAGSASACVGDYANRSYKGLVDAIRNGTHMEVSVRYYKLDQQMAAAIAAGAVDVAVCKTWTLLRGLASSSVDFQRVLDVPGPDGSPLLRGMFIARSDGPVRSLANAAGRPVAVGSAAQYESSALARATLERAGVRPASVTTAGSCLNAAALVWEGKVDLAAVSHYCAEHSSLQLVGRRDAFRVVDTTPGIPWITVALSEAIPRRSRASVRRSLSALHGKPAPQGLLAPRCRAPVAWNPKGVESL